MWQQFFHGRQRRDEPSLQSPPVIHTRQCKKIHSRECEGLDLELDGNISHAETKSETWNPVWLTQSFLIITTSILVALIAALLVLLYLARRDDGLVLQTTNHFSWTYGPTALLTIFVAVWRQLDYHCKALAPWQELHDGHAEARKSILLDYKSPLQVVSLFTAAKNRHTTVVVTIVGFIVLKLVALASTGLLFPTTVSLPASRIQVTQSTRLNGSLYNQTANQGLFDPSIAYTAFAVMTKGLSYADGTRAGMVYEQLALPETSESFNGTVIVRLRALVPQYHCESAPVTIKLQPANVTDQHPEDKIELLFPQCTLRGGGDGTSVFALNPQNFICPERQLSPLLQQIDCDTGPDNWQLLTLTDFRYNQTIVNASDLELGDPVAAASWSTGVEQVTGIACKSAFSVEDIELSYDTTSVPLTIVTTRLLGTNNSTALGNFTGFDMGVLTTSALSASADMFGNLVDNGDVLDYPNVLFKMMATFSGGAYEELLNETKMIESAERALQEVALQSVAKFVVSSGHTELSGTLLQQQERLQLSELSAWIMLSGCTVMTFFTLFLLWKRPRDVSSRNPEPLSSTAKLVANSAEFAGLLKSVRNAADQELSAELQGPTFSASRKSTQRPAILLTDSGLADDSTPGRIAKDFTWPYGQASWWSPLTLKRPILIVSLVLPPSAIGILELLQQLSDQHHGFISISNRELSITLFTRFLPALSMLVIATLINALDFNIAVLAPFNALTAATAQPTRNTISNSSLGLPLPLALWCSLKQRRWGPFLSGSATLIGSVLTIVVSGLFTVDQLSVPQTVSVNLIDRFDTKWDNSVKNDNSAAVLASLTESLGLNYPRYTYAELALPALSSAISSGSKLDNNRILRIDLPALRADLECVKVPVEMFNVSTNYNFRIATAQASVFARVPLPATCLFGGINGTGNAIEFSNTFALSGNSSYVGKLIDLHVGPFDPIQDSSFGELSPNTQLNNPAGCPSLAFIYGFADVDDPAKTSVTTLMCYQYIDQVQTNVSLALADLTIPATQPPTVDESSSKRLPSGDNKETAFQFRLQLHMDDEFSSFNQSATNTLTLAASSSPLDNFFQGVLFGMQRLDQALLASSDEAEVSQVFGSIRGFYRRYMAQAISSNMRVPLQSDHRQAMQGTMLNAQLQPRIVQNRTAKIVLQVQLGLIFLLVSLAVYFSKLHELVPLNPCTIAGVAALFAWSRMCDLSDPVGVDVMRHGGKGLNDGRYRFKLGWWDVRDGISGQSYKWYGIDAVKVKDEG